MIKAIIIDDELEARELLQAYINESCPELEIVGSAENADLAFELCSKLKPDLIFLDVQMPQKSGFNFLSMFDGKYPFKVIFVTAYSEFAVQALRCSAIDYITKPLDLNELRKSVERFLNQRKDQNISSDELLNTLLENSKSQFGLIQKLVIPENKGFSVIHLKDIILLKSDLGYTDIFITEGAKLTSSKPIKYFQSRLEKNKEFYRVNQSYLINLNFIEKYTDGQGGVILLKEKHEVDVPRRKKAEFLEKFGRL